MSYTGMPTPDAVSPQTFRCARIYVPDAIGDIFFSVVLGQISEMTREYYWKQGGTLSPQDAAFLMAQALAMTNANGVDCGDAQFTETGDCNGFDASSSLITYFPQNPFSQPNYIPSGYVTTPFTRFANFPLIGWLSSYFPQFTEDLTGYLPDDIIVDLSSFPIVGDWQQTINGELPRISIEVSGNGIAELHLVNFPLGGRAIVTIDTLPNLVDIFGGIIGDAEYLVELNRDIIAIPPETVPISIFEVTIADEIPAQHTIHITFLPVVDDSSIPLNFGGGIRKIVLCGFDENIMPIVEEIRLNNCQLEQKINGQWIAVGDVNACITAITTPMQTQITTNTTNIATNTTNIATNTASIAAIETVNQNQQNAITVLQGESTDHENRIDVLELNIAQNNGILSNHEQRIVALENASAGGSGGGQNIKTTAYTYETLSNIDNNTASFANALTFPHTFVYENVMIIVELKMINTSGNGAAIRARIDNGTQDIIVGVNEGWVTGNNYQSTQLNQVFEGLQQLGQLNLRIDLKNIDGGTARIQGGQQVQVAIIEYSSYVSQLSDTVTFDDNGYTYTLPSGQDGIISTGGQSGNCLRKANLTDTETIEVEFVLESAVSLAWIEFYIYSSNLSQTIVTQYVDGTVYGSGVVGGSDNVWEQGSLGSQFFPLTGQTIKLVITANTGQTISDVRVDDIRAELA